MRSSFALFMAAGVLAAGCAEQPRMRRALAQPYRPANMHQTTASLPSYLRRVAVLPLVAGEGTASDAALALGTLEPILLLELRKRAAFDVIPISRDQLRLWTGRTDWRQEEPLPPDFLSRIREQTGAEGLVFAQVAAYRPYPPLAVGWRLALVDTTTGTSHWSVDEVFDAGSVEVIKAAQTYARAQMNQPATELDSSAVLSSPSRFGQYAAAAVVATLQPR